MRYILDLHIHSRFSRACSQDLNLVNIEKWCRRKGIDIIGTGDFTHPQWFKEIKEQLKESEYKGLYVLRPEFQSLDSLSLNSKPVYFLCSTEVSCIYSWNNKVRRVHHLIISPSLEVAAKIIKTLDSRGINLRSDGRPIMGLSSEDLLKILLEIDPQIILIPAHVWTPWFSLFGSESGFDSLEECFGNLSRYIYAIETGLSSDPAMNWRVSALDKITLVSNSDAHSLKNLGREANVLDLKPEELSNFYSTFARILREKDKDKFLYTIEFFPEEGKYHYDGHRLCGICLSPEETKKYQGICPVCKKTLTIGVMHRVEELADRGKGLQPANAIPFKSLVPLEEIIAEAFGVKSSTKLVKAEYENLIQKGGSEFEIFLDKNYEDLAEIALPRVVEGIRRVREGRLTILPGYDGEYGKVRIFSEEEQKKEKQATLF
jgi:uncharacterized protein (TIGR00375 family)